METRAVHRNDMAVIRRLLTTPGSWAVAGLSTNTARPAYGVARLLIDRLGLRVLPIHPRAETVFGQPGHTSLAQLPDGTCVDVVDCFVNSTRVGTVVDEAIEQRERLGITAVWLQVGVIDEQAAQRAKSAGLHVVMDTCPAIEYPRL